VFRKFTTLALAALYLSMSLVPVQADGNQYWFRYKTAKTFTDVSEELPDDDKDLTIKYVAAVGYSFRQTMPSNPKWDASSWEVTSDHLPPGITFDPSTNVFSGTPTGVGAPTVTLLTGRGPTGTAVATAHVTFSVIASRGAVFQETFYAHTGHFKSDTIDLGGRVAAASWTVDSPPPGGIEASGLLVQGTPAAADTTSFSMTGYNLKGDPVASVVVTYIIEDGPTFRHISDRLWELSNSGFYPTNIYAGPNLQYAIDDRSLVRYYLEIADGSHMPEGMRLAYSPSTNIAGTIHVPYEQGTVRWKAVDVDGTFGYSNWFTFGTTDPQPTCDPSGVRKLVWYTGRTVNYQVRLDRGAQGDAKSYRIVSGAVPPGVSFNAADGRFSGTPSVAATRRPMNVEVSLTTDGNTTSDVCLYTVEVWNWNPRITDLTPSQDEHVRVGDNFDGIAKVEDAIKDYNVTLASNLGDIRITDNAANIETMNVAGKVSSAGEVPVMFDIANGDGNTVSTQGLWIKGYEHVDIGDIADFSVKRLDGRKDVKTITEYDQDTIIPDVAAARAFPTMTLEGELPEGLSFVATTGTFKGNVTAAPGRYGPYHVTVQDYTTEGDTSNAFYINVLERDGLALKTVKTPIVFTVAQPQSAYPVAVKFPAGLASTTTSWSVSPDLPAFLALDKNAGAIYGTPEFEDLGNYGPFALTVTDSEGVSQTSDAFSLVVGDMALPSVSGLADAAGNVGVEIATHNLRDLLVPGTYNGSDDEVRFSSMDGLPDGLDIDGSTGIMHGVPASEFDGTVKVSVTDSTGRVGEAAVVVRIHPYPAIDIAASHAIPRKSDAASYDIQAVPNSGFWGSVNGAEWKLAEASTPLPQGLSVNHAGKVIGRVVSSPGVYDGIVLQATDRNGSELTVRTAPFSIAVGESQAMTLSYPNPISIVMDDTDGVMTVKTTDAATAANKARIQGSFVDPVEYSIVGSTAGNPGFVLVPSTGVIYVPPGISPPAGEYGFTIQAMDATGDLTLGNLTVDLTIEGFLHTEARDFTATVRMGESFDTAAIAVTNNLGPVTFSSDTVGLPAGLAFSAQTGSFSGSITETNDAATVHDYAVTAKDSHGRSLKDPLTYGITVMPPLKFTSVPNPVTVKQYDAQPLNAAFSSLSFRLGNASFSLSGAVPGTRVDAVYNNGVFDHYAWDDQTSTDPAALPLDAVVFDERTAAVRINASRVGVFNLTATGVDDHKESYLLPADPLRTSANTAVSDPLVVTVEPADPLTLSNTEPSMLVEQHAQTSIAVKAVNPAWGKATATVSGTLPAGITATVNKDAVTFAGVATAPGKYLGIKVTETDAAGRTVQQTYAMIVYNNGLPIDLAMGSTNTIRTKVGYAFASGPAAYGNEVGSVLFGSNDIANLHSAAMSIDRSTGNVAGEFRTPQDFEFDLFVADESPRLTSIPVRLVVTPVMSVSVPSQSTVSRSSMASILPLTSNAINPATYSKGQGNWPEGLTVVAATGEIKGKTTSAAGTYAGLTIRAIDEFVAGTTPWTDMQESNPFTIIVEDADQRPSVAAIADQSFTVGQTKTFAPTITDTVSGNAFSEPGLLVTLNGALPDGLTLNNETGAISGTPTTVSATRSYLMTATSVGGYSSSRAFNLTVMPSAQMALASGSVTTTNVRNNAVLSTPELVIDNRIGTLTYTKISGNSIFRVTAGTGVVTAAPNVTSLSGSYPVGIHVADNYGRTLDYTVTVKVVGTLAVAQPNIVIETLKSYDGTSVKPTATNLGGTATYAYSGLPAGLIYSSATGVISGTLPTDQEGVQTAATVTLTDSFDGATTSKAFVVTGTGSKHRYWKWRPTAWTLYNSTYGINLAELETFDEAGTQIKATTFSAIDANKNTQYPFKNVWDGNTSTMWAAGGANNISAGCNTSCTAYADNAALVMDFGGEVDVKSVKMWRNPDFVRFTPNSWQVYWSDDKTNWTISWSGSNAAWSPLFFQSTR
jgi:hypothetical protein